PVLRLHRVGDRVEELLLGLVEIVGALQLDRSGRHGRNERFLETLTLERGLEVRDVVLHRRLAAIRDGPGAHGVNHLELRLAGGLLLEHLDQFLRANQAADVGREDPALAALHAGYGRKIANTLSEFVIHDSRKTASSGFRPSSAIAPARQNQFKSSWCPRSSA